MLILPRLLMPRKYSVFGVSIDLTNPNPATAVTYTDDAVGMTPGSAAWESRPIFKDIKPCMLKNGAVQYYLNPANYAQKTDGSSADITSGNDGDVMVEFPKIGYQIQTIGDIMTVKVADAPRKAGFRYYAHTRVTEGDRGNLYIGAYKGWADGSNKLRSLSGKAPTTDQTIGTFRTRAQANGAGYDLFSFYPLTLLQCLYLIRFKNLNSQAALGQGYTSTGNTAKINTGTTNADGLYYGNPSGGGSGVKFCGLEHFWGNVYEWIDGIYCDANRNILTAFQGFNDTGSGYTNQGQAATSNLNGWLKKPQGTSEQGFIPKEIGGSSTTFFSDNARLSAGSGAIFGGDWNDGADAGIFQVRVDYSVSGAGASLGARLMYL